MDFKNNYKELTAFIYQDLSWGPLYRKKDGEIIKETDNNAEKYILDSLNILKIKPEQLKGKKVFNIGTGRESRYFASNGAQVTHLDITRASGRELTEWANKNRLELTSIYGDILDVEIGENKYDLIFLSGIYQHIEKPALALVKFLNSLNENGLMYLGFYRSGEFKYFIVDAIRHIVNHKMMNVIRDINAVLFSFSEFNHYQSSRVMDDFFVPKKHNFHPNDIIHDIKLLQGDIFWFDEDFREYNHEGSEYFSVGGDRIYVTKKHKKLFKVDDVKNKLKTMSGKNQLLEVNYKEDLINENIELIKKIKILNSGGFIKDMNIATLAIGLYQFTRPFVFEESYYFKETVRNGRHQVLNKYLRNFLKSYSSF